MTAIHRPRRSVIYMPGSNPRALAKGTQLAVDGIILDLEDAVSPVRKVEARRIITDAVSDRQAYGKRELTVRVNGLDTEWGKEDLHQMARIGVDAIVLPKVESACMVDDALACMDMPPENVSIWCMIETPRGVMHAEEIADHDSVKCLVMGTSDLTKDLRSQHMPNRLPMMNSLSWCLLAARAAQVAILDGVHLDLDDAEGFAESCRQGRSLGFDGKTLIHPKQIPAANELFAPDPETLAWSKKIIEAFEQSQAEGHGVTVVEGKLVENLHVAEARRLLQMSELIAEMAG